MGLDTVHSVKIMDITTDVWVSRVSVPFNHWITESNGKLEARQYRATPALSRDYIFKLDFIQKLNLECLQGLSPSKFLISAEFDSSEMYSRFHATILFGSAYSRSYSADRLNPIIDTFLRAFMGEENTAQDVPTLMRHFLWYEFHAETPWFYGVVWDVGFIVVDEQTNRLAVLALTDTD